MTNTQTTRSKYQGYRKYTVEKNGVIMYRTDVKDRAEAYRQKNGGEVITQTQNFAPVEVESKNRICRVCGNGFVQETDYQERQAHYRCDKAGFDRAYAERTSK